jgi:hypothetical protein
MQPKKKIEGRFYTLLTIKEGKTNAQKEAEKFRKYDKYLVRVMPVTLKGFKSKNLYELWGRRGGK